MAKQWLLTDTLGHDDIRKNAWSDVWTRLAGRVSRASPYRLEVGLVLVALAGAGIAGWQEVNVARLETEARARDVAPERHLTGNQKARLIRTLQPASRTLPAIRVWSDYPSEHVQYCLELMAVFQAAGLRMLNDRVAGRPWPSLTLAFSAQDRGLVIGVSDKDRPPAQAIAFARALRKAGFAPAFTRDFSLEDHSPQFSVGVLGS